METFISLLIQCQTCQLPRATGKLPETFGTLPKVPTPRKKVEPKRLHPWSRFMVCNSALPLALFWCRFFLNMIIKGKTAPPSEVAPFSKMAPGWSCFGFTFFPSTVQPCITSLDNWWSLKEIYWVSIKKTFFLRVYTSSSWLICTKPYLTTVTIILLSQHKKTTKFADSL